MLTSLGTIQPYAAINAQRLIVHMFTTEQEEQTELPPVLTYKEALRRVNELVHYATRSGDAAMLDAAMTMQGLVQDHCIKQATFAKQKSITDCFTAK